MRVTQYDRVLKHLQDYGSITTFEAFKEYGVTRLSAVIYELRRIYDISDEMIKSTNRYGDKIAFKRYIWEETE